MNLDFLIIQPPIFFWIRLCGGLWPPGRRSWARSDGKGPVNVKGMAQGVIKPYPYATGTGGGGTLRRAHAPFTRPR